MNQNSYQRQLSFVSRQARPCSCTTINNQSYNKVVHLIFFVVHYLVVSSGIGCISTIISLQDGRCSIEYYTNGCNNVTLLCGEYDKVTGSSGTGAAIRARSTSQSYASGYNSNNNSRTNTPRAGSANNTTPLDFATAIACAATPITPRPVGGNANSNSIVTSRPIIGSVITNSIKY